MCYEELRNSPFVSELKEVVEELRQINAVPSSFSEANIARLQHQATEQLERLDAEVKHNKTSQVKESTRISLQDYGNMLFSCGDFELAMSVYLRARDYCTISQHVVDGCLNIIRASIELERWEQILNFAARGLSETQSNPNPVTTAILKCVSGLACLCQGRYKAAANYFLECPLESADAFKEFLSPRDIALYTALCGMGYFTRAELRQQLIENPAFKQAIEYLPELRDILRYFTASQPAAWRAALLRLRNDMLLDIYLHKHVDRLMENITEVALVQYVSPFITLEMEVVANAFSMSMKTLEDALTKLVMRGRVGARIDSEKKILYKVTVNERNKAFAEALKTGRNYELHSKAMLFRALLQQHNIAVAGTRPAQMIIDPFGI